MLLFRSKLLLFLMLLIPNQLVFTKCPNKLAASCPFPKACKKKKRRRFGRIGACCINAKRFAGFCARLKKLIALNAVINNNLLVKKNLTVNGSETVNGNETVNGTLSATNLTVSNTVTANNIGKNYINAIKTSNQALTTSFANVTGFSTTSLAVNGWTFNGNDTFTTPTAGTYKIDYVAHVNGSATAALNDIMIRVNVNGSVIGQSPSMTSDLLTVLGNNTTTISGTFLVSLAAGDNIVLQASTSSATGTPQLAAVTVNGTLAPAVALVITPIA